MLSFFHKHQNQKKLLISLLSFFSFSPFSSFATSIHTQQAVQASVVNSCVIKSTNALNFSSAYDPTQSTSTQINEQILLSCTRNASGWVGVSQGSNPESGSTCTTPLRQLVDTSGNFLKYNLSYDASSVDWGCVQSSGRAFTSTSVASGINITAVGTIPSQQDVPAGNYTDNLTITVNF